MFGTLHASHNGNPYRARLRDREDIDLEPEGQAA